MKTLFKSVGFYILLVNFLISIFVYFYTVTTVSIPTGQFVKFTQIYALLAVFYLYVAMMAAPVTKYFPALPFNSWLVKLQKELVVSAFYFGVLHGYFAFFGELGGFAGLGFLTPLFLLAICLSAAALLILTFIAITSFDAKIKALSYKKWKLFHKTIYLVALLIVIHSLMLGTHFINLSAMIPKIFFTALSILVLLETKRLDDYLSEKYKNFPSFGIFGVIGGVAIIYFLITYVFTSSPASASLGIHAQHLIDAKKSQNTKLDVSMSPITNLYPNKKTNLQFAVFDTANGQQVKDFSVNQEKLMHLIIVSDDLTIFDHVHPNLQNGIFSIDYTFPKIGFYRIYTDFQPVGSSEQVFPFRVKVGSVEDKQIVVKKDFTMETEVDGIKSKLILRSLTIKWL